jgi:hypothetical protein
VLAVWAVSSASALALNVAARPYKAVPKAPDKKSSSPSATEQEGEAKDGSSSKRKPQRHSVSR